MKQARYKEPLPLAVIEAARAGDAGAVEQVLQYYNGYINKLCTRTLYDDCGQLHVCVDEYMKHRLENKLIYAIVCNSKIAKRRARRPCGRLWPASFLMLRAASIFFAGARPPYGVASVWRRPRSIWPG